MPRTKETRYDVEISASESGAAPGAIASILQQRGFCVTRPQGKERELQGAQEEVKKLKLEGGLSLAPDEVVDGLLGPEGSSLISSVQKGGPTPSVEALDSVLDSVYEQLQPALRQVLGLSVPTKTRPLLHLTGEPPEQDEPPELTEQECQRWLKLFSCHRLMLIYFLGPGQGELELEPFGLDDAKPCLIVTEPGMLVLLRADLLSHKHHSMRETTALSCFLLQKGDELSHQGAVSTPTTHMLNLWIFERLRAAKESEVVTKDGPERDSRLPDHWLQQMNRSFLNAPQVGVRSATLKFPSAWEPEEWAYYVSSGIDSLVEVPYNRWSVQDNYDSDPNCYKYFKTYAKHCSYIDGLYLFDNKFFSLSPAETKSMDPQQRHSLELSYEALNKAGFTKKMLMRSLVGVYLGAAIQMEWAQMPSSGDGSGSATTGGSASINSNRISFCLGLQGPSYTLDTHGCSSLTAVTHGYQSQKYQTELYKPCHTAISGGMYLSFVVQNFILCCASGFLSPKGRSLTFDRTANGWVKGEGLAQVALQKMGELVDGRLVKSDDKPLVGALAAAVNIHVGASAGLNTPHGPAEQGMIHDALRQAQISGVDVEAVECVGDGRFLCDAMEAGVVSNALRLNNATVPVVLGSVKTNVGMQDATAGMAQVIKVLYAQRRGIHIGGLHLAELNPHIDIWEGTTAGICFNTEVMPQSARSVYAGISSRGMGGTVAHVMAYGTAANRVWIPAPAASTPQFAFWPGGGGKLDSHEKPYYSYNIIGSWSGWSPQEMRKESKDTYSYVVTLGATCYEHFQIVFDGDINKTLHPATTGAQKHTGTHGPSPAAECLGLHWIIDGRPEVAVAKCSATGSSGAITELQLMPQHPAQEVGRPGDQYKVQLHVAGKWRTVDWQKLQGKSVVPPSDDGEYTIVGSWCNWGTAQRMTKAGSEAFAAEVTLTKPTGRFQILRNGDCGQAYFPLGDDVGGPGAVGYSYSWSLGGGVGDRFRIELVRTPVVKVSWEKVAEKVPLSLTDIHYPQYFLSCNGAVHEMARVSSLVYSVALLLQSDRPFLLRVLADGDHRKTFFPSVARANKHISHQVLGPAGSAGETTTSSGGLPSWSLERDVDDVEPNGSWYEVRLHVAGLDYTPAWLDWSRSEVL